ncbi:MAG: GNAT family N-acetyltransferase [Polyangiaceae bacterium]|nr:GNAT family N-acetyltransferase [Polyangiaceae bacterium]MCB9604956.1 GNAT family N-acetyltransferase [Polyangiaceae bacterium]
MQRTYHCEPLQAADAQALAELFAAAKAPCHCRWWDFHGDKNEWLDRCYNRPEVNRGELLQAVEERALPGIVARHAPGEAIVGWLRLSPAAQIPKLYEQRLYRGLPCFQGERAGVMTLGCFLVHPGERRQGVARALLTHGVSYARQHQGTALEAFPRRDEAVGPEALWTGPFDLLSEFGFEVVNDFGPYPVMRLRL